MTNGLFINPFPIEWATNGEIAMVNPNPNTKGIVNKLFTKLAAANWLLWMAPTMAVSITPRNICDKLPNIIGQPRYNVSFISLRIFSNLLQRYHF